MSSFIILWNAPYPSLPSLVRTHSLWALSWKLQSVKQMKANSVSSNLSDLPLSSLPLHPPLFKNKSFLPKFVSERNNEVEFQRKHSNLRCMDSREPVPMFKLSLSRMWFSRCGPWGFLPTKWFTSHRQNPLTSRQTEKPTQMLARTIIQAHWYHKFYVSHNYLIKINIK